MRLHPLHGTMACPEPWIVDDDEAERSTVRTPEADRLAALACMRDQYGTYDMGDYDEPDADDLRADHESELIDEWRGGWAS